MGDMEVLLTCWLIYAGRGVGRMCWVTLVIVIAFEPELVLIMLSPARASRPGAAHQLL